MNRSPLVALTFAVALMACHKAGSPRLEGRWRGGKAEGVLPNAQSTATQFALDTELEFLADSVTVKTENGKLSAKYSVVREDKRSIIIQTDRDGPNEPQTFTFDDERTMRWQIMPGRTLSFVKE
ncbi:MAG: hypothetical protein ABI461_12825 [Polyangiaceae bacterium]